MSLFGVNVGELAKTAALGGAGAIGSDMATNALAKLIPVPQLQSGAGKFALRTGLTLVAAVLARKSLPKSLSTPLIGGAVVGLGIEALHTWVLPNVPVPGVLSGYEPLEQQLAALVEDNPSALSGLVAVDSTPAYSFNNSF